MKFSDITNRLSEEQMQRLRETKTNENADTLVSEEKVMLLEDGLAYVAGGLPKLIHDGGNSKRMEGM